MQAAACVDCALSRSRGKVVFGEGPAGARILLVGEAPGASEDSQGKPFVGRAGLLLRELLLQAGIDASSVYITNLVKCRPPGNRDPLTREKEACARWLSAQLDLLSPAIVGSLGNHATRYLSGRSEGIMTLHGRLTEISYEGRDLSLLPMIHPSAALRSTGTRRLLESDISVLARLAIGDSEDRPG